MKRGGSVLTCNNLIRWWGGVGVVMCCLDLMTISMITIDPNKSTSSQMDSHSLTHSLTLNTSEKKPEPIFSRLKSSRRARLDTALRRARYEDGLVRLVPWTLCSGGSASPRSSSSSGSRLSACVSISDAAGGEERWGGGVGGAGGGGGEGGGSGKTRNVRRSCKCRPASVDGAPCPL